MGYIYGQDIFHSGYDILAIIGTWKSGKTHVQRQFGARTGLENVGLSAVNIESRSTCVIESMGLGAPPHSSEVSLDEQELTVKFSIDLAIEIANGLMLVIGDRISAEDLRLLHETKIKCKNLSIPMFVWHNIGFSANQGAIFRQRMKVIYNAEDFDSSSIYSAPDDTYHLLGGVRSKQRMEHVFQGLRALSGCLSSAGTLEEKLQAAGSKIAFKYFGGVNPWTESAGFVEEDDAESEVSTASFRVNFVFQKHETEGRTFSHWFSSRGPHIAGEFRLVTEGLRQPLEIRSLRGAKAMSMGWMPECCVYETTEPNGRIVKNIQIEAPGVLYEDVEIESTKDGARISARKNVPYHDSFRTTVDEDERCYGLSVRDVVFHEKNAIFQPVPPPGGVSLENGVLHVRLWKVEMGRTVKKRSPTSAAAGSQRGDRFEDTESML